MQNDEGIVRLAKTENSVTVDIVPDVSLEKLRSSSRAFDLFDRNVRDWKPLLERGLVPPLPFSGGELVWGFPILEQAALLGITALPCVFLDPGDRAALFAAALRLENRCGAYATAEEARLYAFMEREGFLESAETAAGLACLISSRPPSAWLREMHVLSTLPAALQDAVRAGVIDVKAADRVRSLPAAFFLRLEQEKERFSYSERRRFALLLREIACRDGLDEEAVVSLMERLFSESDPWPRLRALRYPALTGLEERLAEITAPLRREGVLVRPPDWFEGEEFTFTFTASSRRSYARKRAALDRFEEELDGLFELL